MGDVRFSEPYERLLRARDRAREMQALDDEDVVAALAASAWGGDPFLANVLATESLNRIRRLRAVIDSLAEGVVAVDADGRVTFVNPSLQALLGWPAADALERPVDHVLDVRDESERPLPEDDRPDLAAMRERRPVQREVRIARRDGRSFPAHLVAAPVLRDDEVTGAVVAFRDITPLHEREAQLRDSEQRFQKLFAESPFGIFTLDLEGRFTSLNPAGERVVGEHERDVLGRPFLPFLAPGQEDEALANFLEVVRGRVRRDEYTVVRSNGAHVRLRVTGIPMRSRGEVVGMYGLAEDVTQERETLERLEESEARTRALVNAVRDYAIYRLDAQGHILSWNGGAERVTGYSAMDVIGRHFSIFYPEAEIARGHPKEELRLAAERGRYEEEGWRVRKDGSRFWANVVISAIRDDDGDLVGFAKVTRDLTERKRAEDALRAREARQSVVSELGLDALRGMRLQELMDKLVQRVASVLDVEYVTAAELRRDEGEFLVRSAWGWRAWVVPGETRVRAGRESQSGFALLVGEPVVVDDYDAETRFAIPAEVREQGVRSGMSVVIHGRDGAWGALTAQTTRPRRFERVDVDFLQSVANVLADAIQRREAEDDLERRIQERTATLAALTRDLETFTNSVSHDLRAPLRGIDALAEALEDDHAASLDEDGRALLARLRREAARAQSLVRDVLAFSRSGQKPIERTRVDVTEMARRVARDIDDHFPERRTQWHIQPGMVAYADEGLLRIALHNLLDNASKYSSRASEPRVTVAAEVEDGETVYHVRDNGVGFPPGEAHRLFTAFQRLPSAAGFEGTGLGLATAHRIIQRHGGRITAASQPGGGADFGFTLGGRENRQDL